MQLADVQVAVFGGGSFGTAIGCALARQKPDLSVMLLLRDPQVLPATRDLHSLAGQLPNVANGLCACLPPPGPMLVVAAWQFSYRRPAQPCRPSVCTAQCACVPSFPQQGRCCMAARVYCAAPCDSHLRASQHSDMHGRLCPGGTEALVHLVVIGVLSSCRSAPT